MIRPLQQEDPLHSDIEAAGAVTINIPPPSRGGLHHGDDPVHRRNTNSKVDVSSSVSVEKCSSTTTEGESNSSNESFSAEIPRGHSVLPITSGGSVASVGGPPKRQNKSSPHAAKNMKTPEPKLIHPLLRKIPLHVRFGLNGLLTNVLVRIAVTRQSSTALLHLCLRFSNLIPWPLML